MRRIFGAAALFLGTLSLALAQATGDFEAGMAARKRGDLAAAAFHFLEAAEAGEAPAQRELGRMYMDGRGVPAAGAEAVGWLRKASDQGDPEAQLLLGSLYLDGELVEASPIQARHWLTRARQAGSAEAGERLAQLDAEAAAPPAAPRCWPSSGASRTTRSSSPPSACT